MKKILTALLVFACCLPSSAQSTEEQIAALKTTVADQAAQIANLQAALHTLQLYVTEMVATQNMHEEEITALKKLQYQEQEQQYQINRLEAQLNTVAYQTDNLSQQLTDGKSQLTMIYDIVAKLETRVSMLESTTSAKAVTIDDTADLEGIYTLQGVKVEHAAKGEIYIYKYTNGDTRVVKL